MLLYYLIVLLTYNTLERVKQKAIFLSLITLFWFLCLSCYSRRIHYPTLEKPGAQNIAACKNQGKQCKLNDH